MTFVKIDPPGTFCTYAAIRDVMKRFGGRRFLDVGCGAGDISKLLCSTGMQGIGLDFSDRALSVANQTLRPEIDAGRSLPVPTKNKDDIEPIPDEWGRALIPVDVPSKSVKVSMTIDEALLARADKAAEHVGETRSGFFAAAAQQRIRALAADEVTVERIERALRGVDLVKLVTAEIRK